MPSRRSLPALALTGGLALAICAAGVVPAVAAAPGDSFSRTATYPVYLNAPAGVDPAEETVAEISTITDDGVVVYTDAAGKRIGFVDVTDPHAPVGTGSIDLGTLGHADDQPTSVAAHGEYLLVVIDETGGDLTAPRGRLDVVRTADRSVIRSIDLQGQPDSIAISPDGSYAAIAIENQRDEEATPEGGEEGDLPQLPAGFVQVLSLEGEPADWEATPVPLVDDAGAPLPLIAAAGMDTPEDPEPEYVTIDARNHLAVTLQENNGIVVIDLPTREILSAFSAGSVALDGVDVAEDGRIDLTGSLPAAPREPDAVAWIGDDLIATANEGDWKGGTRGWTIFNASSGEVVWDAGVSLEYLSVRHGLHNEKRTEKKGSEPEGLSFAVFGGTPYVFVASERSNFVAAYDVSDPSSPQFQQLLFTTNGPEGVLPVPGRDLLVISSETDAAEDGVRSALSLFSFGSEEPAQPSIVSDDIDGTPIGWSALGALAGHPTEAGQLYAASDAVLSPATIFTVDVASSPAHITSSLEVTQDGTPIALDVEGISADEDGFWLAVEGETGQENELVRTDASGAILERHSLPEEISAHVGKWGLEGVTTTGSGDALRVWTVIQRPLWADPLDPSLGSIDPENTARIGRLDPATGEWAWFGYPLESTDAAGDWIGLSEITAIDDHTLALIERDKRNGPDAAIKQISAVAVPSEVPGDGALTTLEKRLAIDVLPDLQATNGWTQEKLEGFAVAADGALYAVTDNDGLKDATGETVFLRLGSAEDAFPAPEPTPTPTPTPTAPVTPAPTPTAPVTPAPTPTAPVTPAPTPTAPVTPAPTPTAPVTPAPTSPDEPTPAPTSSSAPTAPADPADGLAVTGMDPAALTLAAFGGLGALLAGGTLLIRRRVSRR